ncbi:MAG: hypothetical protein ABH806_03640 [Candidatus Omnitrophota bacterium]
MKVFLFLLLILLLLAASSWDARSEDFVDFINKDTDGSWFDQAILLGNECDFSGCKTGACARRIFNDTIFRQECEYVSSQYGLRGREWDVSGETVVDVNMFSDQRYYDDLGIQIFGTGENKVLHFEVTSSVNALNDFDYNKPG